MLRRNLLRLFAALPAATFAAIRSGPVPASLDRPVQGPRPTILRIQDSPLAGFQYHEGGRLWPSLDIGQSLSLVRELDNSYDPRAVRIDWRGHKLGYLPRVENAAVAQMLDRGEPLRARIADLKQHRRPWKRMRVEVWWEGEGV